MEIIRQRDGSYAVQSESGPQMYTVTATGCTCPDHLYRGRTCKHIRALVAHLENQPTETLLARARTVAETLDTASLTHYAQVRNGTPAGAACWLELASRQLAETREEELKAIFR